MRSFEFLYTIIIRAAKYHGADYKKYQPKNILHVSFSPTKFIVKDQTIFKYNKKPA